MNNTHEGLDFSVEGSESLTKKALIEKGIAAAEFFQNVEDRPFGEVIAGSQKVSALLRALVEEIKRHPDPDKTSIAPAAIAQVLPAPAPIKTDEVGVDNLEALTQEILRCFTYAEVQSFQEYVLTAAPAVLGEIERKSIPLRQENDTKIYYGTLAGIDKHTGPASNFYSTALRNDGLDVLKDSIFLFVFKRADRIEFWGAGEFFKDDVGRKNKIGIRLTVSDEDVATTLLEFIRTNPAKTLDMVYHALFPNLPTREFNSTSVDYRYLKNPFASVIQSDGRSLRRAVVYDARS